jgi:hypothetical protein
MSQYQENAQIVYMRSTDLVFDKENPRLVEFGASEYSEERLINLLWREMAVDELVMSILAYGFFEHEPLYVMARQDGKYIVLEGNRRLAAIRSLLNPNVVSGGKMDKFVGQITESLKHSLETHIPVIVLQSRQTAWQLLGFKHVNGPAKWSSYAKAKYIAQVHNSFHVGLNEIAEQIGDTNKTVRKLYQGLMVLEQAESQTEFSIDDIRTPRLFFSHLYTALGYEKFRSFIGVLDDFEDPNPVPENKKKHLQEAMDWLYGSKKRDVEQQVKTQNPDLRRFVEVLGNDLSVAALRSGSSLDMAFDLTIDDNDALREALVKARLALDKATSKVGSFAGDEGLVRQAGTVFKLAESIYNHLYKVYDEIKNGKKEILTEEVQ